KSTAVTREKVRCVIFNLRRTWGQTSRPCLSFYFAKIGVNECNRECVLKKSVIGIILASVIAAVEFFLSPQLSGSFHSRCCRLAEEPHQSLDVLGRRCQEELLSHELQSAQA